MKKIIDFTVESNIPVGKDTYLLKLKTPEKLPAVRPGQFVNVQIAGASVLLRRPISICFYDEKEGILTLLVKIAGKGTAELVKAVEGDVVNILLPLGNGFPEPAGIARRVLLVGGGVGIAPLLYLSACLQAKGIRPVMVIGTKTSSEIMMKEEFENFADLYFTTEDGSYGEKGYPTQHSILKEEFDVIYSCGPTPMMKGVAAYASARGTECYVSLENKMACGLGACLCCVENTVEGHKCVCTEGPVFEINELKWQI